MKPAKLVKATFYLPLSDNEGRSLRRAIQEVRRACFAAFDAWTKIGVVEGSWRMQTGQEKIDRSAAYAVVIPQTKLPILYGILRRFKQAAKQEAIYLEVDAHSKLTLL